MKDFVFKTSCSRLRVQDFATDENFSFNQCHNKEFQLAIFSVDISTKKNLEQGVRKEGFKHLKAEESQKIEL